MPFPAKRIVWAACGLLLSQAVFANEPLMPETPPAGNKSAPAPAPQEAEKKTAPLLEYQLDNGALTPLAGLQDDPLKALSALLRESVSAAQKGKPSTLLLHLKNPDIQAMFGGLPPLRIDSSVTGDTGQSIFNIKAFNRTIKQNGENSTFDWQGLNGALKYNGMLQNLSGYFKAPKLQIRVPKEIDLHIQGLDMGFALDGQLLPERFHAVLPVFKFDTPNGDMILNSVLIDMQLRQATPDLQLGKGSLHIGHLHFSEEGFETGLDGLDLKGDGDLKDNVINYSSHLSLAKLLLPEDTGFAGNQALSLSAEAQLNKIDAQAVSQIQTTLRKLRQQGVPEELMGITLLGKLIEMLPAFVSRSPAFVLRNFDLNSEPGKIQGNISIHLDGSKPLNFQQPELILQALIGEAKFDVDKAVLQSFFSQQIQTKQKRLAQRSGNNTQKAAPLSEEQLKQLADIDIQDLVGQGLLVENGKRYTITAQLKDGRLLVNGQERKDLL